MKKNKYALLFMLFMAPIFGTTILNGQCGSNSTYNVNLDSWTLYPGSNGGICSDDFTSTTNGSNYTDIVSFADPIGHPLDQITSITVTFNVAGCDLEEDTNGAYVNQVNYDYPIQINGFTIGTFDPTEMPCTENVCEPNNVVTYNVDPSLLNWNYNGTNTLDLNFNNSGHHVCVGDIEIAFNTTESCPCEGEITGVYIYDQNTDAPVASIGNLTNGIEISEELLPLNYYIAAELSGNLMSAAISVNGSGQNCENVAPYTYPNGADGGTSWNGSLGSYTVSVNAYGESGCNTTVCDNETISFSIVTPPPTGCADNILTNGSFETGNISGWSTNGNPSASTSCYNEDGTYYVWIPGSGQNMWQDLSGTAGALYTLDFFDGAHTIDGQAVYLIFYNSSGNEISRLTHTTSYDVDGGNCTLEANSLSGVAPSGTATVRVELYTPANGLKADGFCLKEECTIEDVVCETNINNTGYIIDQDCYVEVCVGDDVTLSVNPNGLPVSWVGPNGYTATGNAIHLGAVNASDAGDYTATIDFGGCYNSGTITLVVNSVTANAGSDQTICAGGSTTLTASGGGSYSWSNGQSGSSINVSPNSTTSYTVTVTNNGCTDTDQVTVNVNSATANAGSDQTICAGESTTLTASGGGSYAWSNGQSGSSINVSPNSTTSYTVTVTNNGCTDTDQVTVNVNGSNASISGDLSLCVADETTTLTASGGGSYSWSNGTSGSSINVGSGTYTVTVTNNGCTDVASATVFVNGPFANAGLDQDTCNPGDCFTIGANPVGPNNSNYSWNTGQSGQVKLNGNNIDDGQIVVCPTETTTYTLTISDNGCSETDQVTIEVGQANAVAGPDQTICIGETATLTASGGVSYSWSNGQSGASINVSPSATTSYTVTVVNADGCEGTDEVTVNVSEAIAVAGPDQTICIGATATLTASGGESYSWSTGQTGASIDVSPSATTSYTVTVVNADGCEDTAEVTVSVNSATANAGPDELICIGETASLTASGGVSYAWSSGQTGATVNVSPSVTTTYTVTVTAANGCQATDSAVVTVGDLVPNINAGSTSLCTVDDETTLTASGGVSYIWSTGSNDATITVGPGTYSVTATNENDCTGNASVTISVNGPFVDAGPDYSTCNPGDCFTIGANPVGPQNSSYAWSTGDSGTVKYNGANADSGQIEVCPTETTTYTLTIIDNGCTVTDEAIVEVGGDECTGTISGTVTEDTDNDDLGDIPQEGVEIKLCNPDGTPVLDENGVAITTLTDATGAYSFTSIPLGSYIVKSCEPLDYADVSDADDSPEDPNDSDPTVDDIIEVTLEPGEGEDADNNFVDEQLGTISGVVLKQQALMNDDGDIVSVQVPVAGMTITLFDDSGAVLGTALTQADGSYEFVDLPAGSYVVNSPAPEVGCTDFSDEDGSTGIDDPDGGNDPVDNQIPVDLGPGEDDENNDFIDEFELASISGFVLEDTDNNDTGDVPIEGVEIKLLDSSGNPALNGAGLPVANIFTDADGYYNFTELAEGNYFVMEVQPADYTDVQDGDESNDGDTTDGTFDTDDMIVVSVASGEEDEDNNFIEELLGTISGDVTEDTNNDDLGEAPIEGVEIKLLDAAGNPAVDGLGNPVANVLTDAAGAYEFVDLAAGDYTVMEVQPADYADVQDGDESSDGDATDGTFDTDDMIAVTLTPGEDDENNDFIEELLGTISGDVTEDTNNDDLGEAPIEGVEIKLLDAAGNPAVDGFGNPVANVLTDAAGAYEFVDLAAGDYTVMEVQPADYTDVQDGDESSDGDATDGTFDTDDMIAVTLTPGEDDENNDFIEELLGTISGDVTEDTNNDDAGDAPIEGVEIKLLDAAGNPAVDANGNVVANVLTDANGAYEFVDLAAGDYTVMEVQPADYTDVQDGDESDDGDASDLTFDTDDMIAVTLAPGEDDENNDFIEELLGTISGDVTEDTDNDDAGDAPIEGVEIKLLDAAGNPAVDANGNLVANVLTDANGAYEFVDLAAGDYTVMEVQPVDYTDVQDGDESDDGDASDLTFDTDDMIAVTLTPGEDDENNDFIEEQLGTISGFMFKTQALINDDGDVVNVETPVAGMIITLYDADGAVVGTAETQADGSYEFTDLPAGSFVVSSPAPLAGCTDLSDEDASTGADDPDGGNDPVDNEIPVDLVSGEDDADNNFVDEFELASISGFVTEDIDDNDTGDVPIEGVEIKLLFANGGPALNGAGLPVANVFTDADGYYNFTELAAGDYFVMEVQPADFTSVLDGDASDDGDFTDGTFDTDDMIAVSLVSGEEDENNDFIEEAIPADPCADWVQGEANTALSVGVVTNPGIVGSESDLVNITFVVVNTSSTPITNVDLETNVLYFTGLPTGIVLNATWAGDPNNNGQLDPNEIWFYSAVNSFNYNQGDSFIISGGATGNVECGEEIGGAADLLFTSGVNMDVKLELDLEKE